MRWMRSELKQEEIKEISVLMLEKLVERGKTMAVVFYDPEAEDDRYLSPKIIDCCAADNGLKFCYDISIIQSQKT